MTRLTPEERDILEAIRVKRYLDNYSRQDLFDAIGAIRLQLPSGNKDINIAIDILKEILAIIESS